MPTHTALLHTIGPFLLFSNTWSSLKIFLRQPKPRGNDDVHGCTPALQLFVSRALRFLSVVVGLQVTGKLTRGRSTTLQKTITFVAGAALHYLCQPFHWTLSLYFSLRAGGLLLVRARKLNDRGWPVALVRHPVCIFLLHCCHNYFLTHQADLVSPHYLKLWLQVLPIQYKKLDAWLQDFNSTVTQHTQYYRPEQCGRKRVALLPTRLVTSFKRQLPLVAATFLLPVVVFKRSVLFSTPTQLLCETLINIIRSSLVLTALPFLLTEWPCMWGLLTGSNETQTVRRPMLHTVCVSLGSTGVFLLEPANRLRMIVIYTYWRVAEVVMLRTVDGLSASKEGVTEQRVAMLLTGLTSVLSSMM